MNYLDSNTGVDGVRTLWFDEENKLLPLHQGFGFKTGNRRPYVFNYRQIRRFYKIDFLPNAEFNFPSQRRKLYGHIGIQEEE
jgi:hypothetical protein